MQAIIADHLTDFELGGDGYLMHLPESPPHLWAESVISRLGRWAGGRDRHLRRCDYQIEHQPSRSGGCLNVTCVQCENGKSISPIDSAQPTMAHDADTDSDLTRPPDCKHPSARHATLAMLLLSSTRRHTAGHVVAHPGPSDSE